MYFIRSEIYKAFILLSLFILTLYSAFAIVTLILSNSSSLSIYLQSLHEGIWKVYKSIIHEKQLLYLFYFKNWKCNWFSRFPRRFKHCKNHIIAVPKLLKCKYQSMFAFDEHSSLWRYNYTRAINYFYSEHLSVLDLRKKMSIRCVYICSVLSRFLVLKKIGGVIHILHSPKVIIQWDRN